MLLLVGLVAIVLVIVVVVFLSVRSMRADEDDERPARTARPDRPGSGRGDRTAAGRRAGGRRGQAGRQPARHGPADDDWLAGPEPEFSEPGARLGARLTGNSRDKPGADWPAGDWGGVSDEQYWAELSADKPLATTARSAQPGADARPAAVIRDADWPAADPGGRGARRDPAPAQPQPEPAPIMAAAGESATPAEPWAGPVSAGGMDTDPGIGGWRDGPGEDAAAWQVPGEDAAAWQAADTRPSAARDTGTWAAEDPLTSASFAEDPLTSPSFAAPGTYSADSRSYRGSHHRGRGRHDEPADPSGGAAYGRGHDYQTAPAWDNSDGSHADGWRDSGHEYPSGRLDPLPKPAASAAEPPGSRYSAPTSSGDARSHRQPSHQSWERGEAGYQDRSWPDPYPESGQRRWQATERDHREGARYDLATGYGADHGPDFAPSGYVDSRDGQARYDDRAGYDDGDTGYEQPGRGYADAGYGRPRHDSGEPGYQPSHHSRPDTGYELPGYARRRPDRGAADADYGLPAYGSGAPHGGFDQDPGHARYPGYHGGRR